VIEKQRKRKKERRKRKKNENKGCNKTAGNREACPKDILSQRHRSAALKQTAKPKSKESGCPQHHTKLRKRALTRHRMPASVGRNYVPKCSSGILDWISPEYPGSCPQTG